MKGQTLYHLEAINFSINKHHILSIANLDIARGIFLGVIGQNGSGKTTFLRLLCGLIQAQSGRVLFCGKNIAHEINLTQRAQQIAWIPAEQTLPFDYTVSEVIAFGRHPWRSVCSSEKNQQEVARALNQMGLVDKAAQKIGRLSSGERKKVYIARALATGATCLILDEPWAFLDLTATLELIELLKKLNQQGTTIILSTHELALAFQHLPFCLFLHQGLIRAFGATKEVLTPELLLETYQIHAQRLTGQDPATVGLGFTLPVDRLTQ